MGKEHLQLAIVNAIHQESGADTGHGYANLLVAAEKAGSRNAHAHQAMDKGCVSASAASIRVDANSDEQEDVLATPFNRFAWQRCCPGLSDFSATPWEPSSSE